jgi:hypothetical protein
LDKELQVKLTDFGLSKVKLETQAQSQTTGVKNVGTLRWMVKIKMEIILHC